MLSTGTSAALFAALIGVMAITSEFRHGTIRPTFVVTPRRSRVIVAKVLASLLMGVLFGLAAIGLSFGIGYAILAGRDIPLALSTERRPLARARHADSDRSVGRTRRRLRRARSATRSSP